MPPPAEGASRLVRRASTVTLFGRSDRTDDRVERRRPARHAELHGGREVAARLHCASRMHRVPLSAVVTGGLLLVSACGPGARALDYGTGMGMCPGAGIGREEAQRWSQAISDVYASDAGTSGMSRPTRDRPCFLLSIEADSLRPGVAAALRARGVPPRAVTIPVLVVRLLSRRSPVT